MSANRISEELSPDNPGLAAQMRPALVKYFKRKTGSAVEAEDLAQDVLVRALLHADWKSRDQAKGYIFRTAVNRWRDRQRRLRTQRMVVRWNDEATEAADEESPPERVLIVQEELGNIAQAIEELNVRTRTVLMMIRLEQMRVASVAEKLGISVSAVNKHLARGLAHLARARKRQDSQ